MDNLIHRNWNMREKFVKSKMWIMLSYLLIDYLKKNTHNALIDSIAEIKDEQQEKPANTLVISRNWINGQRLASIHAQHLGAQCIYMGII